MVLFAGVKVTVVRCSGLGFEGDECRAVAMGVRRVMARMGSVNSVKRADML